MCEGPWGNGAGSRETYPDRENAAEICWSFERKQKLKKRTKKLGQHRSKDGEQVETGKKGGD